MKLLTTIYILLLIFGCNQSDNSERIMDDNTVKINQSKQLKRIEKRVLPYQKFIDFKGDTLKYLHSNFVTRKAYYINRPISLLLSDLEPTIIRYYLGYNLPTRAEQMIGITLIMEKDVIVHRKWETKKVPNTLDILINDTVFFDQVRAQIIKDKSNWNEQSALFFKKFIVKDINMTQYNDKKTPNVDLKKY